MALSWNEIKDRALAFSKDWADTSNEDAEAKSYLDQFFNVFGISRKKIGTFEHRIKKLDEKDGYIDLLWKGTILIEMKSRGKNLDRAYQQAIEYTHGLKQHELPKYILVSDFETFHLHDLEENKRIEFKLKDLADNVQHFGYILGYQKKIYKEQDPANIKAAELMGKLHDRLKEIGFTGHPLEVYLVRVLFLMFAEDTTIFNKQQFQDYIEQRTNEDGSDLAAKLQELFQTLNTPKEKRFKNLDEQLAEFPYVNGKLFEEILPTASFDAKMRQAVLNCCYIDWSKISPAIFGSMFQSVMNPLERRSLGAHYTSEANILKLIKLLFLDDLWQEFETIKKASTSSAQSKNRLAEFHKKLSTLKFLDPACGCGNFLVITYRELRLLELEILRELYKSGERVIDIGNIIWLNVDQFYGIELEEFPARIAEVAMWLIDHQMNMLISAEFGQYFVRLPLKKSAIIVHGNALQIDWSKLIDQRRSDISVDNLHVFVTSEPMAHYNKLTVEARNLTISKYNETEEERRNRLRMSFDYILGNPPFVGKQLQSAQQKADINKIFGAGKGSGVLDYVACWYIKAAEYIRGSQTKAAFVSTNSITQGEQVGALWNILFNQFRIKIHFAHRTFQWNNEAKGNAAVHCIIIGFANFDTDYKRIFEYEKTKGTPQVIRVKNISPYLIEGKDIALTSRTKPINRVPELVFGNMANDDGNLILHNEMELKYYSDKEPEGVKYIRPFVGSVELINNIKRYCFWLKDANPSEIRRLPILLRRIEKVKIYRDKSSREATKKLAAYPSLFGEIRQKEGNVLVIPRVSSENRLYIPIAFFDYCAIINDSCTFMNNATLFHFGILTSVMHMTWVKYTCGRLKSDFRYSNNIVYNNYPWPENPSEKQIKDIEEKAQKVLDARSLFPGSSLADLYAPLAMPHALIKAHQDLDMAVDLAYRPQAFTTEAERMVFLFELYEKYTADLFTYEKPKKAKKLKKINIE